MQDGNSLNRRPFVGLLNKDSEGVGIEDDDIALCVGHYRFDLFMMIRLTKKSFGCSESNYFHRDTNGQTKINGQTHKINLFFIEGITVPESTYIVSATITDKLKIDLIEPRSFQKIDDKSSDPMKLRHFPNKHKTLHFVLKDTDMNRNKSL